MFAFHKFSYNFVYILLDIGFNRTKDHDLNLNINSINENE